MSNANSQVSQALNLDDPARRAEWLLGLRTDLIQADGITCDLLRPVRERELGQALHQELYAEAWARIARAMQLAGYPLDEPAESAALRQALAEVRAERDALREKLRVALPGEVLLREATEGGAA
jgi:hypothetical protein